MSESDKPFFVSPNQGLGRAVAADELLHPASFKDITADSATETQYLGFSVPEANIHAIGYLWHHPNLKVVTGGLCVWQGVKRYFTEAELADARAFMRDTALKGDLHEYRLDNGYGVRVLEPLKKLNLTYTDAARKQAVDLTFDAVADPVMFGDGNHFEQPMRVTGSLTLRGREYKVDCFNVRDRSWGKPRPEDNVPMAPISWTTGVFGPDFAFNANVLDQHDQNPEIQGRFEVPAERTVIGGWLRRDGVVARIVSARKRVEREPVSRLPRKIELDLTDDAGRTIELRGTLQAACPWQIWPNLIFMVCLMKWECEGQVAYGDCQEAYWNDYLNHVNGQVQS